MTRRAKTLIPALLLCVACTPVRKFDPRIRQQGSEPAPDATHIEPVKPPIAHTVIVVGDGFDPLEAAYAEQVTARYTLDCDYGKFTRVPFSFVNDPAVLEQSVNIWLNEKDQGCSLREEIKLELAQEFEEIDGLKTKWNDGLVSDPVKISLTDLTKIKKVLHPEKHWRNYIGTAQAALIAHENPQTSLVLIAVNPELFTNFETVDKLNCPRQPEIDALANALKTEGVREAFSEAVPTKMERVLHDLVQKHQATIIVSSLFQSEAEPLQEKLLAAGCTGVSLNELFQQYNELAFQRTTYRLKHGFNGHNLRNERYPLVIAPAGNTAKTYNSNGDMRNCEGKAFAHVQVGASDTQKNVLPFSGQGACIDFYVPADLTIVHAPNGFLNAVSGSEISAAVLARFISNNYSPADSPQKWLEALTKLSDKNKFLPVDLVPDDLKPKIWGTAEKPIKAALIDPLYLNQSQHPFELKTLRPMPYVW